MAEAVNLFQPFQRFHSDPAYPGSGIGLAIAQQIIQRHHGAIWAESKPDEGTTIYFTIAL
jgi:signal transduction histidine kinase